MSQQSQEFVIQRKRRRHSQILDPSPPLASDPVDELQSSSPPRRKRIKSRRQLESTPQKSVTVEDFLRWSATTPQRKKKTRVIDLNGVERSCSPVMSPCARDPSPEAGPSSRRVPSTDGISSSSPLPNRKAGTLSERMILAAALSHVDLDKAATMPHIRDPERPSLKLGTIPPSTMESTAQSRQKWRLVDPRKVFDLGSSEFKAHSPQASVSSISKKSLDHWRPEVASTSTPKTKRKRKSHPIAVQESPEYRPLTFLHAGEPPREATSSMPASLYSQNPDMPDVSASMESPSVFPRIYHGSSQRHKILVYDSDPPGSKDSTVDSSPCPGVVAPSDSPPKRNVQLSQTNPRQFMHAKPLKPFSSLLGSVIEPSLHTTRVDKHRYQAASTLPKRRKELIVSQEEHIEVP
ncbi:hypothetical protein BDW22DRAFT_1345289 [Trametopsis cervina]|nr:hypothetical protein BDW22DRAFT_1345289 [Trametopsis cervina]